MPTSLSRILLLFGFVWFFSAGASAETLPTKLSDTEFWNIVRDFSESSGSFPAENFTSNERSFQKLLPNLKKRTTGGAYLGVGPEQNFTYIAVVHPEIAFIVDIRRQNMIEHLMYKALFEISANRVEFLSLLFSRPLPRATDRNSSIVTLLDSLRRTPRDHARFEANLDAIRKQLIGKHGFDLSEWDKTNLEYVYRAFYDGGPEIGYDVPGSGGPGERLLPSIAELLTEKNPEGFNDNFLSSEENFRTVQNLERNNLIVPVVGDFAGSSAIPAVGEYLRQHNASVAAFYTSNVEQYLFLNSNPPNWEGFYRNLSKLPLSPRSLIVRALVKTDTGAFSTLPAVRAGYDLETMLFSAQELVAGNQAGTIRDYADILRTGNLSVPDTASLEVVTPLSNTGVVIWPDLTPPSNLTATAKSSSEIELKWPKTVQSDKTGYLISKEIGSVWGKPIHLGYSAACNSDDCSFRDSDVKAGIRYCYYIQAADDYSNIGPVTFHLDEDYGDPSKTVCAIPGGKAKE